MQGEGRFMLRPSSWIFWTTMYFEARLANWNQNFPSKEYWTCYLAFFPQTSHSFIFPLTLFDGCSMMETNSGASREELFDTKMHRFYQVFQMYFPFMQSPAIWNHLRCALCWLYKFNIWFIKKVFFYLRHRWKGSCRQQFSDNLKIVTVDDLKPIKTLQI